MASQKSVPVTDPKELELTPEGQTQPPNLQDTQPLDNEMTTPIPTPKASAAVKENNDPDSEPLNIQENVTDKIGPPPDLPPEEGFPAVSSYINP